MILLIDACLTPAAMVNAVITATEVKTQVLMARGVRTPEGYAATGTSTDTIAVASTGSGTLLAYAGPVTLVGWLIGRCVRTVLEEALRKAKEGHRNVLYSGVIPLLLALLLDLVLGDPPNRYHPVAWMGAALGMTRRRAPPASCVGPALRCGGGRGRRHGREHHWDRCGSTAATPPSTLVLAGRSLCAQDHLRLPWSGAGRAAGAGRAGRGELERARQLVSWHLVSRDTATLTPSQVAAATVESVAENASDGIIAPLLFYALGVCQPHWPIVSSIRRMRCWAIVMQSVNG